MAANVIVASFLRVKRVGDEQGYSLDVILVLFKVPRVVINIILSFRSSRLRGFSGYTIYILRSPLKMKSNGAKSGDRASYFHRLGET